MAKRSVRRRNSSGRDNQAYVSMELNFQAMEEGPKRKHWSIHDLKAIKPLTYNQEDMFHAWFNDKNVCASGSAGTGKTFLALYLALLEVLEKRSQRIIIVRSAVPTRDLGHLPGTVEEKLAPYERPYTDILWELIGRASTYQDMKDAGIIEFMPTSYLRGLTWDNCIVVVEEGENMTFHEIDSIMTRLGDNSRVIFTGDCIQTDLGKSKYDTSGMKHFLDVIKNMSCFECINFTREDIVRSGFVKAWITASEDTAVAA